MFRNSDPTIAFFFFFFFFGKIQQLIIDSIFSAIIQTKSVYGGVNNFLSSAGQCSVDISPTKKENKGGSTKYNKAMMPQVPLHFTGFYY
jgi:hypothetical protein